MRFNSSFEKRSVTEHTVVNVSLLRNLLHLAEDHCPNLEHMTLFSLGRQHSLTHFWFEASCLPRHPSLPTQPSSHASKCQLWQRSLSRKRSRSDHRGRACRQAVTIASYKLPLEWWMFDSRTFLKTEVQHLIRKRLRCEPYHRLRQNYRGHLLRADRCRSIRSWGRLASQSRSSASQWFGARALDSGSSHRLGRLQHFSQLFRNPGREAPRGLRHLFCPC